MKVQLLFTKVFLGVALAALTVLLGLKAYSITSQNLADSRAMAADSTLRSLTPSALLKRCGAPYKDYVVRFPGTHRYMYREIIYIQSVAIIRFTNLLREEPTGRDADNSAWLTSAVDFDDNKVPSETVLARLPCARSTGK